MGGTVTATGGTVTGGTVIGGTVTGRVGSSGATVSSTASITAGSNSVAGGVAATTGADCDGLGCGARCGSEDDGGAGVAAAPAGAAAVVGAFATVVGCAAVEGAASAGAGERVGALSCGRRERRLALHCACRRGRDRGDQAGRCRLRSGSAGRGGSAALDRRVDHCPGARQRRDGHGCSGDLGRGRAAGEDCLDRREEGAQVPERAQAPPGRLRLLAQEVCERPAAAKDEGLDGRAADTELRCDLVVREPARVAQQDCAALLLGQLRQSVLEPISSSRRPWGAARPWSSLPGSHGDSRRLRRPTDSQRVRQTLRAIPSSQAISVAGTTPRRRPRTAWRKSSGRHPRRLRAGPGARGSSRTRGPNAVGRAPQRQANRRPARVARALRRDLRR